jgi:phospholipid transport system substrate-binding protein
MSPAQQQRFVDAFSNYVANAYAKRFSEYSGDPDIYIGKVIDAGKKGYLVESPIRQENGQPIDVEWLVSDRGGKVQVVDIIIEGVSLATTQREEIASMFQRRGQDVDALISGLAGG